VHQQKVCVTTRGKTLPTGQEGLSAGHISCTTVCNIGIVNSRHDHPDFQRLASLYYVAVSDDGHVTSGAAHAAGAIRVQRRSMVKIDTHVVRRCRAVVYDWCRCVKGFVTPFLGALANPLDPRVSMARQ
jgi:hypothetical protein